MTAIANEQDQSLTIQWLDDNGENEYSLFKKLRQDTSWGEPLLISGDENGSYVDEDIIEGQLYEYRIMKVTNGVFGYGYLFSGLNFLPAQRKGDLLILIDSLAMSTVQDNLNSYTDVLISEGWIPQIILTSAEANVAEVKNLILEHNSSVDSLTSVILMGNIAIPHSGDIKPDAHNDHKGAWPADLYYGDLDGVWTDDSVNNVTSAYPRIHNVPNDGSFDQDFVPGEIELKIGRLDFSELPVFDMNEHELLNRYLKKNIEFRTGEYEVRRKAVYRNLNLWVEGLGQNAIRNFTPLVSPDSIETGEYFAAFNNSYLWSYGSTSGSQFCAQGLGCMDTYANNNFQAVFTSNFGSYFGDYDFENNLLRSILASGRVLSAAWVGAPNWYYHPMGMGFDLGYATRLTQNNAGIYYTGVFPKSVTVNLLGDPSLEAYILAPPKDLVATPLDNQVMLTWTPSSHEVIGYQVYKKDNSMRYFEPLNEVIIQDTSFVDSCVEGGQQIEYLVKAVKKEITPSGSFINHSTGPIIRVGTNPDIIAVADFELIVQDGTLVGNNLSSNSDQYLWLLPDGTTNTEADFEIPWAQSGSFSVTLIVSNACFSDTLTVNEEITITSVSESTNEDGIDVFPNPAQKSLTLNTITDIERLELFDNVGKKVLTITNLKVGTHKINLNQLPTGVLLLQAHIDNRIISKKIMHTEE